MSIEAKLLILPWWKTKLVKPSHDVFNGTYFSVKKKNILNQFEILDLPSSRVGAKIVNLFLRDITPKSQNEKKETIGVIKNNFKFNRKPSKKERRDISNFLNE